jgi:hypothetical protein
LSEERSDETKRTTPRGAPLRALSEERSDETKRVPPLGAAGGVGGTT